MSENVGNILKKRLVKYWKMIQNEKDFLKKGERLLMKKLYGTIMINKQVMDKQKLIRESVNYYKLKDKKYGIEIVKENEVNEKLEIANLMNVTDNEDAINYILSLLVNKEIMPKDEDVIDEIVKYYT